MDTLHSIDTRDRSLTDGNEGEAPEPAPPETQSETDETNEIPAADGRDARVFGGKAIFAVGGRRISDYPWGAPDYR